MRGQARATGKGTEYARLCLSFLRFPPLSDDGAMTKQISEAQAWRECARFYAKGTDRVFICNDLNLARQQYDGRWHSWVPRNRRIPLYWPHAEMQERIESHANGETLDRDNYDSFPRNDARVIFCLLMALECEEETRPAP